MSAAAERRARLEDERDVLLEQIDALDAELAAGQIDEADHAALKDDLVRRTAQVLRRLDRQRRRTPRPISRRGLQRDPEAGARAPKLVDGSQGDC